MSSGLRKKEKDKKEDASGCGFYLSFRDPKSESVR